MFGSAASLVTRDRATKTKREGLWGAAARRRTSSRDREIVQFLLSAVKSIVQSGRFNRTFLPDARRFAIPSRTYDAV